VKNHTKPCDSCPFLKKNGGMLRQARAEEIVDELSRDGAFWCHKTVDYSNDCGGRTTSKTLLCAGSLICGEKCRAHPGQIARIRYRIGVLDWGKIEAEAKSNEEVFDDFAAFIDGHQP
jgi:hypothetical protein